MKDDNLPSTASVHRTQIAFLCAALIIPSLALQWVDVSFLQRSMQPPTTIVQHHVYRNHSSNSSNNGSNNDDVLLFLENNTIHNKFTTQKSSHTTTNNDTNENDNRTAFLNITYAQYKAKQSTWYDALLQAQTRNITRQHPTIMIHLNGGMGNNLSKLAHGLSVALWMYYQYDVMPRIVLRHQDNGKWRAAAKDVRQCFPLLRDWDFEEGHSESMALRRAETQQYIQPYNLQGVNTNDPTQVASAIHNYMRLISEGDWRNSNMSAPLLITDRLSWFDLFVDRFITEIRQLFLFDRPSCCQHVPEPDETVLVSFTEHVCI
jgi:hypothetical protein